MPACGTYTGYVKGCRCVECCRANTAYRQDFARREPEKAHARERRYKLGRYGLEVDQYAEMVARQGGLCAICHEVPESARNRYPLEVDHDHKSGVVRGLLCGRCNRGIGLLADSADRLQQAAEYLRSYQ